MPKKNEKPGAENPRIMYSLPPCSIVLEAPSHTLSISGASGTEVLAILENMKTYPFVVSLLNHGLK